MVGADEDLLMETERLRNRIHAMAAAVDEFIAELTVATAELVHDTEESAGGDEDAADPTQ